MIEMLRRLVKVNIIGVTIWFGKRLLSILNSARIHRWERFGDFVDELLGRTIAKARRMVDEEKRRMADRDQSAK